MSQGKYSPVFKESDDYGFNCYGERPPEVVDGKYDGKIHNDGYDSKGYDRYGYSAFSEDEEYVGYGGGIDANGYTEMEYLAMDSDKFLNMQNYW